MFINYTDKRCSKCGAVEGTGVIIQAWSFANGSVEVMCNTCAHNKAIQLKHESFWENQRSIL